MMTRDTHTTGTPVESIITAPTSMTSKSGARCLLTKGQVYVLTKLLRLPIWLVSQITVQRLASSHDSRVTPVSNLQRTEPARSQQPQRFWAITLSASKHAPSWRQTHQRVLRGQPRFRIVTVDAKRRQAALVLRYHNLETPAHIMPERYKSAPGALSCSQMAEAKPEDPEVSSAAAKMAVRCRYLPL